jgi:integrase
VIGQGDRSIFNYRGLWADAEHEEGDGNPIAAYPKTGAPSREHTHAMLLLEAGVDVKTVGERLGHDTVQTTLELYGHVTQTMRSNAAARFGSLFNTARTPLAAVTAEN